MARAEGLMLSVVVPVFNESQGLPTFHKSLLEVLKSFKGDSFEVIYCDDGSTDGTSELVRRWSETTTGHAKNQLKQAVEYSFMK